MKTLMSIAIECNVRYNEITEVVKKERIKGVMHGNRKYIDKYQEEIIHRNLYFNNKLDELIIESKMNRL